MWPNVITGLFALAGVTIGVALEPIKSLIGSRARTRQIRGEHCAKLISAVTTTKYGVISLNAAGRARNAGQPRPQNDQVNGWIDLMNKARSEGRETSALLYLYGPTELANEARKVQAAEETLYFLLDDQGASADPTIVPQRLHNASEALDSTVRDFATLARRFTR